MSAQSDPHERMCPGCGYYALTHGGVHRDDCTAPREDDQ